MNFPLSELIVVSPLIWLLFFGLIPLVVKYSKQGEEMSSFTSLTYATFGAVGAIGLTLSGVKGYWKISNFNFVEVLNRNLVIDGIGIWGCYIVFLLVGFCLFLLYDSKQIDRKNFSENLFLFLFTAVGMALVVMSNDMVLTFFAIETVSISIIFLMWVNKGFDHFNEVFLKYFILNGLTSLFFIYGVSMIYGGVGSTNHQEIGELASQLYQSNSLFRIGVVLVIVGLAGKVAMAPFHSWAPDVEQGLPTPLTALVSTAMRVCCFVALLRFFIYADFFDLVDERFISFLQWLSVLTILVGGLAAMAQKSLKRLLAYGGIGHSGYAFAAIGSLEGFHKLAYGFLQAYS